MNIIHFIDSAGLYGAEKMLLALCKEQKKAGLKPTIVSCGEEGQELKPLETEALALNIDTITWRMKKGFNLTGTKQLLQVAKLKDADIYHSHGYKFNILLGYFKSLYTQKFITTVHGYIPSPLLSKGWLYQTLDKLMLKRADSIVYVNEIDRQRYANGNNRALTIDNGIEIRPSQPTTSTHNYKMVFIGRLSREKGVDLLPHVMKEVLSTYPSLTLDIYGLGPLFENLKNSIESLKLAGAIKLKGYLDNAGDIIEQYDCVLMPSLTEGLPIVALEAINNQRVILCTKVGGLPHLLGLDYPFFIGEINDTKSIESSIDKLYKANINTTNKLSETLKLELRNKFSSELMSNRYMKTYNN